MSNPPRSPPQKYRVTHETPPQPLKRITTKGQGKTPKAHGAVSTPRDGEHRGREPREQGEQHQHVAVEAHPVRQQQARQPCPLPALAPVAGVPDSDAHPARLAAATAAAGDDRRLVVNLHDPNAPEVGQEARREPAGGAGHLHDQQNQKLLGVIGGVGGGGSRLNWSAGTTMSDFQSLAPGRWAKQRLVHSVSRYEGTPQPTHPLQR